eukprot:3537845-Pyramimonas_sp.AAC.1
MPRGGWSPGSAFGHPGQRRNALAHRRGARLAAFHLLRARACPLSAVSDSEHALSRPGAPLGWRPRIQCGLGGAR